MVIKKNYQNLCILISAIFVSATVIILLYNSGVSGNDFWWHIKAGEWICENSSIPTKDIFSWYGISHNLEWISHEWLSEIILYKIYAFGGEPLVLTFCMFSAFLFMILLMKWTQKYWKENTLFIILWFSIGSIISSSFFQPRPQIFSFFLFAATIKILYDLYDHENSKTIYFLPLISLLWTNFHGGSSNMPYLLCFIFMFCGFFNFSVWRFEAVRITKKQLLKYFFCGILSAGTILINPHGISMLFYPYANMADSFMLSFISEWASPDAKDLSSLVLYIPLIITSIGLVVNTKKVQLTDTVLFLLFAYMYLRSIRFGALMMISYTFLVFRYPIFEYHIEEKKQIFTSVFLGVMAVCITATQVPKYTSIKDYVSEVTEDNVISIIKEDAPQRLYNCYNFGEFLIKNNIPVFIDARADVYTNNILRDGINIEYLKNYDPKKKKEAFDIEATIEKYNFDAFFIRKNSPLNIYLRETEKYELLYDSETACYWSQKSQNF